MWESIPVGKKESNQWLELQLLTGGSCTTIDPSRHSIYLVLLSVSILVNWKRNSAIACGGPSRSMIELGEVVVVDVDVDWLDDAAADGAACIDDDDDVLVTTVVWSLGWEGVLLLSLVLVFVLVLSWCCCWLFICNKFLIAIDPLAAALPIVAEAAEGKVDIDDDVLAELPDAIELAADIILRLTLGRWDCVSIELSDVDPPLLGAKCEYGSMLLI